MASTKRVVSNPAIEKQEPVAWADPEQMREYFASSMKPAATIYYQSYGRYTKPLYAAPVDETGQGEPAFAELWEARNELSDVIYTYGGEGVTDEVLRKRLEEVDSALLKILHKRR